MELSKTQSEKFIQRYLYRYGIEGEDITECVHRVVFEGIDIDEEGDRLARKHMVKDLLGKEADKLYKHRPSGPETKATKVYNSLYMNYGPKYARPNQDS